MVTNHEELPQSPAVQLLTVVDVLSVYSGRPGCMCGCKGKYFLTEESREEADAFRGYPHSDEDVSQRQVTRVLRLVQAAEDNPSMRIARDLEYVWVQVGQRVYAVYLTQGARNRLSLFAAE